MLCLGTRTKREQLGTGLGLGWGVEVQWDVWVTGV